MSEPTDKHQDAADCGIPESCERVVGTGLIVLDNAPTALMFLLGSALIWNVEPAFSILFFVYCCLSIVMFWRFICPWCHHFGGSGCPCGYGRIASRFFKRKTGKEFKKVFRQNIRILFPCWVIPSVTGVYLLWRRFSWELFYLFLSFCLVGFVLIPAISRFVGCKSCKIRDDCPWMS